MSQIEKYNVKHLTEKQKKKCARISKMILELSKEGVHACVASTPTNKLIFYAADKWLDSMEDIQDLHNHKDDYVFDTKAPIDAVGY